jgi:hypothetical protein
MKVIVVPSQTPFLIANSVFRALGAVIDTASERIFFQKLGRSIPISLSERNLFCLDLPRPAGRERAKSIRGICIDSPECRADATEPV